MRKKAVWMRQVLAGLLTVSMIAGSVPVTALADTLSDIVDTAGGGIASPSDTDDEATDSDADEALKSTDSDADAEADIELINDLEVAAELYEELPQEIALEEETTSSSDSGACLVAADTTLSAGYTTFWYEVELPEDFEPQYLLQTEEHISYGYAFSVEEGVVEIDLDGSAFADGVDEICFWILVRDESGKYDDLEAFFDVINDLENSGAEIEVDDMLYSAGYTTFRYVADLPEDFEPDYTIRIEGSDGYYYRRSATIDLTEGTIEFKVDSDQMESRGVINCQLVVTDQSNHYKTVYASFTLTDDREDSGVELSVADAYTSAGYTTYEFTTELPEDFDPEYEIDLEDTDEEFALEEMDAEVADGKITFGYVTAGDYVLVVTDRNKNYQDVRADFTLTEDREDSGVTVEVEDADLNDGYTTFTLSMDLPEDFDPRYVVYSLDSEEFMEAEVEDGTIFFTEEQEEYWCLFVIYDASNKYRNVTTDFELYYGQVSSGAEVEVSDGNIADGDESVFVTCTFITDLPEDFEPMYMLMYEDTYVEDCGMGWEMSDDGIITISNPLVGEYRLIISDGWDYYQNVSATFTISDSTDSDSGAVLVIEDMYYTQGYTTYIFETELPDDFEVDHWELRPDTNEVHSCGWSGDTSGVSGILEIDVDSKYFVTGDELPFYMIVYDASGKYDEVTASFTIIDDREDSGAEVEVADLLYSVGYTTYDFSVALPEDFEPKYTVYAFGDTEEEWGGWFESCQATVEDGVLEVDYDDYYLDSDGYILLITDKNGKYQNVRSEFALIDDREDSGVELSVADAYTSAGYTTYEFTAELPEDFDAEYTLVYYEAGTGYEMNFEAEIADGRITFDYVEWGEYTLYVSDRNRNYLSVSADFTMIEDREETYLGVEVENAESSQGYTTYSLSGELPEDFDARYYVYNDEDEAIMDVEVADGVITFLESYMGDCYFAIYDASGKYANITTWFWLEGNRDTGVEMEIADGTITEGQEEISLTCTLTDELPEDFMAEYFLWFNGQMIDNWEISERDGILTITNPEAGEYEFDLVDVSGWYEEITATFTLTLKEESEDTEDGDGTATDSDAKEEDSKTDDTPTSSPSDAQTPDDEPETPGESSGSESGSGNGTAESTEPAETTPSTSGDSNSGSGSGSGGSGSSGGSSGGGSGSASSSASGSWRQDEGGWWYQYADGSYPANRWVQINSQWYYFGGDGYTCSGWQLINGSWYYLDRTNQNMTTGWHQDPQDGYRYYLDRSSGRMLTGWQLIDDAYYYFNPVEPVEPTWTYDEGSAAWNHTNASYRPFGSLYVSGLTPDGYSVDGEGKWIR